MNNKDNMPNEAGVSNDAETKRELSTTAQHEQEVLSFWNENKIFQKTLDKNKDKEEFVFYDGPPFATGLPHHGHILAGVIKDAIPRYQTMKGKYVNRVWGWDCHGLPIEEKVEDQLGISGKEAIEEYGIEEFNEIAREKIFTFEKEWKDIIPRTGRFVDMDNSYKTMDNSYMESVWAVFKKIADKDLVYKSFKPMHLSPALGTTLSNMEVAQNYKDITDISVTAKFELKDEKGTFILAWTTTPWTLPGNAAIAVGDDIDYVKASNSANDEKYIFAKEKFEEINDSFNDGDLKIEEEFKGSELVGRSYIPVFDFYSSKSDLENKENGWKVWSAEFVTTDSGTGIVHIAPAFGQDDFNLGKENSIPFIQHVDMNGKYTSDLGDLHGKYAKPLEDHQSGDIEILKLLAPKGLIFSKKKIIHSYPHCWRTEWPLLNYATSSWFIKVADHREKMVELNNKVGWVPEHVGKKRFGNWLEAGPDWAFSRERFWGCPIPIWQSDAGDFEIVGSIDSLREKTRSKNNIVYIRHGKSVSNEKHVVSCVAGTENDNLSEEGIDQVKASKQDFEKIYSGIEGADKPDVIISSPFNRTQQTAKLVADMHGIDHSEIILDDRIKERDFGEWEGKPNQKVFDLYEKMTWKQDIEDKIGNESTNDVKRRMMEFLYDIDSKYEGKNIVVVTHFTPYWTTFAGAQALSDRETYDFREHWGDVKNAYPRLIDFAPVPHDKEYRLDMHRPFIDRISWANEKGDEMKFVGQVFDCWVESGSMAYASNHYPFENLDKFDAEKGKGFPADFIAEGLDQTRGWFYSSLALGTLAYDQSPFKNVIVNGMVMAEDGKKMSKSKNNFTSPVEILDTMGADAMRLYLLASPLVRGENTAFFDSGVDEVLKKIVIRSKNVLSFYKMYSSESDDHSAYPKTDSILDKWILQRLYETEQLVSKGLDRYELDKAAKPFFDFVDDLSTWYLRRSRDRLKAEGKDKDMAVHTLGYVLREYAKVIAPFTPFLSENIWQTIKSENDHESIHLCDWPVIKAVKTGGLLSKKVDVIKQMKVARDLVSVGLEKRSSLGLKVRQPLSEAKAFGFEEISKDEQLAEIIKDELNIKKLSFEVIENTDEGSKVDFDTEITDELKKEGVFRDFTRLVQSMRKKEKMVPDQLIELKVETNGEGREILETYKEDLEKIAGVKNINYSDSDAEENIFSNVPFKVVLVK